MGALPNSEPFAFRFAPYIKELREFFASSRLHYGSPEDIFPVTERLQNSKTFAEDMSSMIRSILLREGGSMAHAQLLEILAISIGGPEMEEAPQAYRQPLRQLLSFLTGVLRRPWNLPPGEEPEPPAPAGVATYSTSSDTFDHPEVDNFPPGPSGPFAAAAALSAAELKPTAPKPPARELTPPRASPVPEDIRPVESEVEAAPVRRPSDSLAIEPEYGERDFAEYEALNATLSEPAVEATPPETEEVAEAASEPVSQEASEAEPQPILDPIPAEAPALAEAEAVETEYADARSPDQQSPLEASPEPVYAEPEPAMAMAGTPEAASEPESAVSEPAFAAAPHDFEPAELAAAKPEEPQPVVVIPAPIATSPATPASVPAAAVAKRPHHHSSGLSSWHDSPFDDSYVEFEAIPAESVVPARPAAAPWIVQTDDTPENPSWLSASTRNVVIAGAAAIAVAVLVAIALRPTPERAASVTAATSPTTLPAVNSGATSLTPQPAQTSAVALPAKPTPYGDPFTPQQNPNHPLRTRSDEDEEYTGSDVAPPTYRSFVTPTAPAAAGTQQPSSVNASQSSNAYSNQQTAPVERRSPETSLVSEPVRQSFRNPDATLAGDPRPVRPMTPSRSLNGSPAFKVSSGVMAANLISAPNPDYPTLARLTHTQGEVIIQAVISRDGRVSTTHVLSGHRLLRGAAVDAVKRWRYRPYVSDGHPVDVATIIRVDFRAHN